MIATKYDQYVRVVPAFLKWLKKETHLKPIWALVGYKMETCAAEERVNPDKNIVETNHDVGRKVRHAEREGIKIVDLPEGEAVPQEIQDKCNARIKDWQANRTGK